MNILLIALMCVIWGNVIFKFFGKGKTIQQNDITSNQFLPNKDISSLIQKTPFELNIINTNPFGETKINFYIKKKDVTDATNKTTSKILKKPELIWPTISYYGFVKNDINDTKLVLLKINNKFYRKREKELIEDLKIISAFSDSVIVSVSKEKRTIKKQE